MNAKYAFTGGEEGNYSVRGMCRWAKGRPPRAATTGGTRAPSPTARWRAELGEPVVLPVRGTPDGTYGYRPDPRSPGAGRTPRRPADDPVRSWPNVPWWPASRAKAPTTTISSDAGDLPDLVNRDFTADEPGHELVADITYIRTWQGWVYLTTVLDCATKKAIGYAMAEHLRTDPGHRRPVHDCPRRPHPTRNHHFPLRCRNAVHQ